MLVKLVTATFAAAVVVAAPAHAVINLVSNGGFETTSYKASSQIAGKNNKFGQGVASWTGAGGKHLEFLFIGGTQTSVSAANQFHDKKTYFGPSLSMLSPNGGNFVALDGDGAVAGMISQQVNGLTINKAYKVSFDWGAAQLLNRKGKITEQLKVGFGTDSQFTNIASIPTHGFSGWMASTFLFKAKTASEMLSFLSMGTPKGLPPIAVLDGVSVTTVPEASTWMMLVAGFGFAGLATRRRRMIVVAV